MTGNELRNWRHKVYPVRVVELAELLDVTPRTIYAWEALGDDEIPHLASLACAAIAGLGLATYNGRPLRKR